MPLSGEVYAAGKMGTAVGGDDIGALQVDGVLPTGRGGEGEVRGGQLR